MMNSKMFRKLAEKAIDHIAEYLDQYGDSGLCPVMRVTTKFGTVVVGVETGTLVEEESP
jgi:hypothetical protein